MFNPRRPDVFLAGRTHPSDSPTTGLGGGGLLTPGVRLPPPRPAGIRMAEGVIRTLITLSPSDIDLTCV